MKILVGFDPNMVLRVPISQCPGNTALGLGSTVTAVTKPVYATFTSKVNSVSSTLEIDTIQRPFGTVVVLSHWRAHHIYMDHSTEP